MNRSIRRVGVAVTVLILALVAQLTYLQVVEADRLERDPRNVRAQIRDFARPRGQILTSDGEVVAQSVKVDDEFEYQREYPLGSLFGHISGYQSFTLGNTGVEDVYNDILIGRDTRLQIGSFRNLGELFSGKQTIGNVGLTISAAAQAAARDALGDQRGSVVALDPRTGAVLAMYSNPSYDPQPLASHKAVEVDAAFAALNADPLKPSLPRAWREIYPPGSTFKVVTTSVGLETGTTTPETQYDVRSEIDLPQTSTTIQNFGGSSCGGTLVQSFIRSCNTTFAQIGLELGEKFPPGNSQFGIGSEPPLDENPRPVASQGPQAGTFEANKPQFAQAGIGQGPVAVTPLQMALVAAAVANNGVIAAPHVLAQITDADGKVIRTADTENWKTAMPPQVAATVAEMMRSVVNDPNGTGTAAAISDVTVAGKTGTAQHDDAEGNPLDPHAWFIAFAPAEAPRVAIAVIVESGGTRGGGDEITGGRVAAPIAKTMIQTLLGLPPG
jgi:peptidoglycan glycosyltransferase